MLCVALHCYHHRTYPSRCYTSEHWMEISFPEDTNNTITKLKLVQEMYTRLLKHRQIKDFHYTSALKLQQTSQYPQTFRGPCLDRQNERVKETWNSCRDCFCIVVERNQTNQLHFAFISLIPLLLICKNDLRGKRIPKLKILFCRFSGHRNPRKFLITFLNHFLLCLQKDS